jgi:uncharacterized membrane protein YgdD (TMEM256/DUF423 family)
MHGTPFITSTILILLAAVMGVGGVVLAAAAAHAAPGAGLESAAYMLLFHAAAVLGGVSLLSLGQLWRPLALVALVGFELGGGLFASDIALRIFSGHRLFTMAAPTGGIILIGAWLALAASAIGGFVQR